MKFILRLNLILSVLSIICISLSAQRVLPLQKHKLQWADAVYKNAVLKNDTTLLAEAWFLYGKTYEGAGDLLTARKHYLKSLSIIEPVGDSPRLARLYLRLANNEMAFFNYKNSKKYSYLTLKTANKIKDSRFQEGAFNSLVSFYNTDWSLGGKLPNQPGRLADSVKFYKKALDKISETRVKDTLKRMEDSLYLLQMKIADIPIKLNQKKYTLALQQSQTAADLAIKLNRKTLQMEALILQAQIYLKIKQYHKTSILLDKIERFLESSAFKESMITNQNITVMYRDYYVATENWEKAYEYSSKLNNLILFQLQSDRNGAVSRLMVEYETEKKEILLNSQKEELALKESRERISRRFNVLLISLLFIAILVTVFYYRLYLKNQQISKQNEILVREQNHRVNNNLQSISSLLNLQSQEIKNPQAKNAITESQQRVETMAILNRKLYSEKNIAHVLLPDYLEEIAENVLNAYGYDNVQLETKIAPIFVSADTATPLGLIINELITNSCKYAFPQHPEPHLEILCHQISGNKIYLQVSDNGKGIPFKSTSTGMGMKLIKMLVTQLYGKYNLSFINGTIFTMDFPSSSRSSKPEALS